MQLKKIKVGARYQTRQGEGVVVSAGGTFPPRVLVDIQRPFPLGRRNVSPRDVLYEVGAETKERT
jgi:hypothetical protein